MEIILASSEKSDMDICSDHKLSHSEYAVMIY